jgi:TP901 family phage tail tape measure protein
MALSQGGAAAKTAGLSFDETTAFLEALASAGVKGSDAGTSMKTR